MKIEKFGGTSVANTELLNRAREIMNQDSERSVAVISACGKDREIPYGVTNLLLVLANERTPQTGNIGTSEAVNYLQKRYGTICRNFGFRDLETEITGEINSLVGKDRDYIASRGENYNARIFARLINYEFVDPKDYIIIRDKKTRQPDLIESAKRLSALRDKRIVIAGFYGSLDGRIITFNRGGSDLTQGLVANALNASLAENFTDVDGVYYADPTILKNPSKIVPELTYRELRELSSMKSKISEDAIYPMMIKGIPLQIRSSKNLESPGTIIRSVHNRTNGIPIAGVSGRPGTVSMSLYKYRMDEEIGFTRKVLSVLEDFGINVQNTPATTDYQGVNFRRPESFSDIKEKLKEKMEKETGAETTFMDDDLALVSVVGEGMQKTPGIMARVATSLAREKINLVTISQGPSESNIVLGVKNSDYINAINAIHDEFVLNQNDEKSGGE